MMKLIISACLLIHSASAFARPFWGRSSVVSPASSSTSEATSAAFVRHTKKTGLQATPDTAVHSKPAVIEAGNWELLSERGQAALSSLIQADEGIGAQAHVYADWPAAGTEDEGKKRLAEQVSPI